MRQGDVGEVLWGFALLNRTTERTDGVLCARVSGRVDSARARDFAKAVSTVVEESNRAMILDFEEVAYISSDELMGQCAAAVVIVPY